VCAGEKLAVTAWSLSRTTLQAPVPEQAPPQPAKVEFAPAAAVSDTLVPCANDAEQIEPHVIPPGLLVTVPEPVPALETDRVRPGACVDEKVAVTDLSPSMTTLQAAVPAQPPPQPAEVAPAPARADRRRVGPGPSCA